MGIEVKPLFKKNHIDLLNPSPEAEALEEKRVLINRVLEKVISGELYQMIDETLGHSSQLWSGSVLMRTATEAVHMFPQHHRVQGQHICSTEDAP